MALFGTIFSWKHINYINNTATIDTAAILPLGPLGNWVVPYIYLALLFGALFGVLILFIYYESQKRLQKSKSDILNDMKMYEERKGVHEERKIDC
jgi:uncharacterized membrane protein YfcA